MEFGNTNIVTDKLTGKVYPVSSRVTVNFTFLSVLTIVWEKKN